MDKVSKEIKDNKEGVYAREELLTKVKKWMMLDSQIATLRKQLRIADKENKTIGAHKLKLKMQVDVLEQNLKVRDSIFIKNKLRKTVIHGLPCEFLHFQQEILPPTELRDCERPVQRSLGPLKSDDGIPINIRAFVWKIICNVDEIQQRCLDKYLKLRATHQ